MIKKFILSFIFVSLLTFCSSTAEVFQYVGQEFDWDSLSQQEKIERADKIFRLMFPSGKISNYTKKEFKEQFKSHLKDVDAKINYDAMVAGYSEYKNLKLQPYYYKDTDYIYLYALQYKSDPTKTYYYSLLGNLKFVDIRYGDLENYPCYIKKYSVKGKLVKSAYLQSQDIIYTYDSKGRFEGVSYKGKLYK